MKKNKNKKQTVSSGKCVVCESMVNEPKAQNLLEDQVICDSCREQMFSSLEVSWKKYSAFLDSALN